MRTQSLVALLQIFLCMLDYALNFAHTTRRFLAVNNKYTQSSSIWEVFYHNAPRTNWGITRNEGTTGIRSRNKLLKWMWTNYKKVSLIPEPKALEKRVRCLGQIVIEEDIVVSVSVLSYKALQWEHSIHEFDLGMGYVEGVRSVLKDLRTVVAVASIGWISGLCSFSNSSSLFSSVVARESLTVSFGEADCVEFLILKLFRLKWC